MPNSKPRPEQAAIRTDLGAIFVSMELSRSTWVITALAPGAEKMSRHSIRSGNVGELLERFAQLNQKARMRTGADFPIIVIQEAGLDGFWIHRMLESEGIESHVVDPASILTSRRRRRAKTDTIDGETLVRTLMAHKRGEPRVCAMVRVPTPQEEDRRRICRERKTVLAERIEHVNRIKGLLFAQGIFNYEPLHRNCRKQLDDMKTGDGRALPTYLKAQIERELDRLELVVTQLKAVEAERDALLEQASVVVPTPAMTMANLKGVGPEHAAIIWSEGLYRSFANRRQVAAYAGLAPTPWQSGSVDREQGVSKAGNPRLRTAMIQLAWLWLRHQRNSALSRWFHERVRALALFGSDLVGDPADSHEIDQRVGRVGRRFDEDDRYTACPAAVIGRRANGCLIDTVGETHSADAKIGQGLGKQRFGAAIKRLRMHDGVARTGKGKQGGGDGRHAGREQDAGLGPS